MSVVPLEFHPKRRSAFARPDESLVHSENEWQVTKFKVESTEYYRLKHVTASGEFHSVFTYEVDTAQAVCHGISCVRGDNTKTPREKMVHLNKLLQVMMGIEDGQPKKGR